MSRYDDFSTLLSEVAIARKTAGALSPAWLAAVTRSSGTAVVAGLVGRFGAGVLGGAAGFAVMLGPLGWATMGALAGIKLYKALSKGADEKAITREAEQIDRAERLHAKFRQLAAVDRKRARREIDALYQALVAGDDVGEA